MMCLLGYRETKTNGPVERIAIETDRQLGLELPAIINGPDKLQGEGTFRIMSYYNTSDSIWKVKHSMPDIKTMNHRT